MKYVSEEKIVTKPILDSYIHRVLWLGENLSTEASYTVIVRYSGTGHILEVKGPDIAASIACDGIQTPGNLLVPIVTSGHPRTQQAYSLDSGIHRVVNTGVDVSTQANIHAAFIADLQGGIVTDHLLIVTTGSIEKIQVGGSFWKIPPNTGIR